MAKIVRVMLTFWQGDRVLLHLLIGDLVGEVADTVEARHAFFLLSDGTTHHGASRMWLRSSITSLARAQSSKRRRDSRSIELSFQRFSGSKIRELNRNFCSSSWIENQYLIRRIPNRTSMRSNSRTDLKNSSYSSSVQKLMTFSTPADYTSCGQRERSHPRQGDVRHSAGNTTGSSHDCLGPAGRRPGRLVG